MSLSNFLLVGIGGFLGSIARYATSVTIDKQLNSVFPYGTFTVNIIGSFLLGLIYGWVLQRNGDATGIRLLLITGFCGGFTTFSAFAFENYSLMMNRHVLTSFTYVVLSIVIGLLAVLCGIFIMKK